MRKGNKVLVLLVLLLLVVALLAVRYLKDFQKKKNTQINLSKELVIDKIAVKQANQTCQLDYVNGNWMVDLTQVAHLHKINLVLSALTNLKMNYPVSKQNRNELIDSIQKHGISLALSYKNKKEYSIDFMEINKQTLVLNSKGNLCFAIIPSLSGANLTDIIKSDSKFWLDNVILKFDYRQITRIQIAYSNPDLSGFRIEKTGTKLQLSDKNGSQIENSDTLRINDYLKFFSGINYMPWNGKKYKFESNTPLFQMEISAINHPVFKLKSYALINNEANGVEKKYFAGIINQTDTVMLNYSDMDPYMTSLEYFLKK